MSIAKKLEPKTLDEIIFPNSKSERWIRGIAEGKLQQNLLFYGGPGNGKTTTARLLPKLIDPDCCPNFYNASKDRSIDFVRKLETTASLVGFSSDGRNYIILDEADQLTTEAQKALKGIVDDKKNAMFILTMNDFASFDTALADRFTCISFDSIGQTQLMKLAERINDSYGITLSPSDLDAISKAACGSIRGLIRQMELASVT